MSKVFAAMMTIEPWFHRVAFAHVDGRKRTVFARADQHIDASPLEFRPMCDNLVVASVEDNANTRPK